MEFLKNQGRRSRDERDWFCDVARGQERSDEKELVMELERDVAIEKIVLRGSQFGLRGDQMEQEKILHFGVRLMCPLNFQEH